MQSETFTKQHEMLEKTLALLSKDPLLNQFAHCYLSSFSTRSLESRTPQDHAVFIQDRYDFFLKALKKPEDYIRIYVPEKKLLRIHNRYVIEFVCPDAQFLLATIETILKEKELEITRMLHPIMALTFDDKKKLTKIAKPCLNQDLYSVSYIEFEDLNKIVDPEALLKKIKHHVAATQTAHRCLPKILEKLRDVQKHINAHDFTLAEPKEEWINLIDWLKTYNFTFLGYGAYTVQPEGKSLSVTFDSKSGRGILNEDMLDNHLKNLRETLQQHVELVSGSATPFVFDTIPYRSPTQRFENLMRLSFKFPRETGGYEEHIFLGILKRSSL